jgi:hypothetical protein
MLKQLALTVIVSAAVSGGVSWLTRPVPSAAQESRLQRIEGRLHRLAKIAGIVFGEDGA